MLMLCHPAASLRVLEPNELDSICSALLNKVEGILPEPQRNRVCNSWRTGGARTAGVPASICYRCLIRPG